jgi:hypothetical protein
MAVALLAATAGLGFALPAHADVKASQLCRKTIGIQFRKVSDVGLKGTDACHAAKDKVCTAGMGRGQCNLTNPPSAAFDPKGKYADAQGKADDAIDGAHRKCLAGDPVLGNYTGGDPDAAFIALIDDEVSGVANLLEGTQDLPCGKVEKKCRETIGKSKTAIIRQIIKDSIKCQGAKDLTATMTSQFGAIDPTCVADGGKKTSAAMDKIAKDCASVTGNQIGVCTPLPDCVISNATQVGQDMARAVYQIQPPPPPPCGNGVLDTGEQCDHGALNGTPGDTCSATCERLDDTCTVTNGTGHRLVKVSIDTPTALGGLQVQMDYPQSEAGIPGIGSSSVVNSRLNVLQPVALKGLNDTGVDATVALVGNLPGGIAAGDLFQVTFDNCVALSENICNRNQNVYGCCNDPNDPNQFQIPAGSEICQKKACATNPAGQVCTTDADCGGLAGDCQGILCRADTSVCNGNGTDQLPQYGICVFKCPNHTPICANGHFPPSAAGTCDGTPSGPNGGCPSNNACETQLQAQTCHVAAPVDVNGQPVDGVTCTVTVTEVP